MNMGKKMRFKKTFTQNYSKKLNFMDFYPQIQRE